MQSKCFSQESGQSFSHKKSIRSFFLFDYDRRGGKMPKIPIRAFPGHSPFQCRSFFGVIKIPLAAENGQCCGRDVT